MFYVLPCCCLRCYLCSVLQMSCFVHNPLVFCLFCLDQWICLTVGLWSWVLCESRILLLGLDLCDRVFGIVSCHPHCFSLSPGCFATCTPFSPSLRFLRCLRCLLCFVALVALFVPSSLYFCSQGFVPAIGALISLSSLVSALVTCSTLPALYFSSLHLFSYPAPALSLFDLSPAALGLVSYPSYPSFRFPRQLTFLSCGCRHRVSPSPFVFRLRPLPLLPSSVSAAPLLRRVVSSLAFEISTRSPTHE
jgi:hypothetical protein